MTYYGGLDWGSEEHAVCVVDERGRIVLELRAFHTREGLREMVKKLARLGPPQQLAIAIERPNGLVVDALIEAGHPVVPIHPNVVKASRPRYRAAGGKSDPGDAYLLSDLLRTDGHRFQPLKPDSDEIKALQAKVRTRDGLVAERIAMTNQLREILQGFWPGATCIFSRIDSPIGLAFIDRYPTPQAAKRLGPKRLATFLRRQAYSGGRTPQELLERLRAAPRGLAGPAEETAKGRLCQALGRVLTCLVKEIAELTQEIERTVAGLPAGRVLMSFPRAGKLNAAQILAEIGDDPRRFPSEAQLAAEGGVVPVTFESGKHRGVHFRFACNKRLRKALTCFADNSRHESPWARQLYEQARDRGCDHPHAVRIVARSWVRVLWRAWKEMEPYNVTKHGNAQALIRQADCGGRLANDPEA